jgi:hypothetical protein
MKILLQSTDDIFVMQTDRGAVPVRLWEGATEHGIPVRAFIAAIAVSADQDQTQFDRELHQWNASQSGTFEWPEPIVR